MWLKPINHLDTGGFLCLVFSHQNDFLDYHCEFHGGQWTDQMVQLLISRSDLDLKTQVFPGLLDYLRPGESLLVLEVQGVALLEDLYNLGAVTQ